LRPYGNRRWGVAPAARKQHGQTALHVAAWKGHLQAVEALLAAADQLDCVDDLGRSPLHWAVAHGHLEVRCPG
jgi:ankyrin repeat protein